MLGLMSVVSAHAQPVRVLACFDSFKDSLAADDVAHAVLSTLREIFPGLDTRSISLSDGGHGFLNALKKPLQLEIHSCNVTGWLPFLFLF